MVHEQKFKDILSSTCQVSVERRVKDLESQATRGLGSVPTGANILSLEFFLFSCSKDKNANRVFSKCTRMAIMPILPSEVLLHENKKSRNKMLPLVGIEPLA